METQQKPMRFDDFITNAATIFAEMEAHGTTVLVERDGQLFSVKPKLRRLRRARRQFSPDDPLFEIVGMGHSSGPGDISTNKHRYLADAIADLHGPETA